MIISPPPKKKKKKRKKEEITVPLQLPQFNFKGNMTHAFAKYLGGGGGLEKK